MLQFQRRLKKAEVRVTLCLLFIIFVGLQLSKMGGKSDDLIMDSFKSTRLEVQRYPNLTLLHSELPDVFSTLPESFLPQYRSFCWMHPTMGLVCLPAAYVAGMPKCGSTELFTSLIWHQNLVSPKSKENQFWARFRFQNVFIKGGPPESFAEFLTWLNANEIREDDLLVDGSQSLAWEQYRWEFRYVWADQPPYYNYDIIHHITPDAKILIILRNPVERLYSDYLFFKRGEDKYSFDTDAKWAVAEFNQCLDHNTLHNCCYNSTLENRRKVRIFIGVYICYIIGWKERFGDNLLVVQLEKLSEAPVKELMKTWRFLGVPTPDISAVEQFLAKKPHANTGKNYSVDDPEMLNSTYNLLNDFYKPYNLMLANYLGDNNFAYD